MPLLKVNQIASYSGNTLTVGTTGDTVTLATGASVSGFGFDGVVWTSNIVTSALTVSANVGYFVNTSSAAITVTLPASASNGDQIIFTDYNRKWGTNALTLNQNSLKFQGYTSPNPVYNTDGQTVQLVYADSTQGWIPISDDNVTNEVPQPYTADIEFLVVGGGGGSNINGSVGGYNGGGGAGGYRTSTQTGLNSSTLITVTVGDGGAGTNGSNSSISGSGLTTITSAGGGKGAQYSSGQNGYAGGSGGGSSYNGSGGAGNTPSTSPSQGNNGGSAANVGPLYGCGGGGGAGAVGGNGGSTTGGNGGAGTANSITGSSVTYAGGGGGGVNGGGTAGTGGAGGGGNGSSSTTAQNGTANTGGGAGGGDSTPITSGGSGVIILRMLTTKYSGVSTGSPTVTTDGSYTVVKFTGSGTYTI